MEIVKLDRIRSYQTLVKKHGKRSYRTMDYKVISMEIKNQLQKSKVLKFEDNAKLGIELHFFSKRKSLPDFDNASKFFVDVLQEHYNFNDKKIISANIKKHEGIKNIDSDYVVFNIYEVNNEEIFNEIVEKLGELWKTIEKV